MPLPAVQAAARKLGGSVNDVYVTGLAERARPLPRALRELRRQAAPRHADQHAQPPRRSRQPLRPRPAHRPDPARRGAGDALRATCASSWPPRRTRPRSAPPKASRCSHATAHRVPRRDDRARRPARPISRRRISAAARSRSTSPAHACSRATRSGPRTNTALNATLLSYGDDLQPRAQHRPRGGHRPRRVHDRHRRLVRRRLLRDRLTAAASGRSVGRPTGAGHGVRPATRSRATADARAGDASSHSASVVAPLRAGIGEIHHVEVERRRFVGELDQVTRPRMGLARRRAGRRARRVANTRERHCAHAETVASSSPAVSASRVSASLASSSTSSPSSSRNRKPPATGWRVRRVVASPR